MKALLAVLATILLLGTVVVAQNFPTELPKTAKLASDSKTEVALPSAQNEWVLIERGWIFFNKETKVPVGIDTTMPQAEKLLAEELLKGDILVVRVERFILKTDGSKAARIVYVAGEKNPVVVAWREAADQEWFTALVFPDGTATAIHSSGIRFTPIFDKKDGALVGIKFSMEYENGIAPVERTFLINSK